MPAPGAQRPEVLPAEALSLVEERDLPEHLPAQREDEREPVVPLHPADWNTDQLTVAVQHAAARDAGMTVGQAGDEVVRRSLTDVAGRENDALRVVVAEAEDRVREIEGVAEVHVERRKVQVFLHFQDGPVAGIHFRFRLTSVDDAGRHRAALVHELHGRDLAALGSVAERDDAVLHRNEVTVPEVPGRAVVAGARGVVGIHLDETLPPLAQEADRQEAHLGLQLVLDIGHERGAAVIVHGRRDRLDAAAGAGNAGPLPPERADFGTELGYLVVVVGGGVARCEQTAEAEEEDGGKREQQGRNQTSGHWHSKFGSCTNSVARGYPRRLYRLD